MKRGTSALAALAAVLMLAGCAPAVTQVQIAAVPTQTAYPTNTPYATYTPQATFTAAPTIAVIVNQPVTVTQLVIITATPLPATATAALTATPTRRPTEVASRVPLPTWTPRPPTDLPGPTNTLAPTDVPPTDTDVPPTPNFDATEAAINDRALHNPKFDGNYLVNVDIAPGVWRNDGSASDGTDCYWERLTKQGGIIDNYIGAGNGTMFIDAGDFSVRMTRCGKWTFISQ